MQGVINRIEHEQSSFLIAYLYVRTCIVRVLIRRESLFFFLHNTIRYSTFTTAYHDIFSSPAPSGRYFILFISIIQIFIAMYTMSSRGGTEAFISLWSSIVLLLLCVGGTVIMRKFQSSVAVGFFMGSVVAASQMFMLVFLM